MSDTLHICFGTMTGNAESLASSAEERAKTDGWNTSLLNLEEVKASDLNSMNRVLFVVSTWGDGEPPDDAAEFWDELAANALDLTGLTYAVFGLGDRDYDDFNAFARNLDERLAALGAKRLSDRVEADLDFDEPFDTWVERIFPLLGEGRPAAAG